MFQSSVKLFSLQPPDGKLKKTVNASKQELCCNWCIHPLLTYAKLQARLIYAWMIAFDR